MSRLEEHKSRKIHLFVTIPRTCYRVLYSRDGPYIFHWDSYPYLWENCPSRGQSILQFQLTFYWKYTTIVVSSPSQYSCEDLILHNTFLKNQYLSSSSPWRFITLYLDNITYWECHSAVSCVSNIHPGLRLLTEYITDWMSICCAQDKNTQDSLWTREHE